jgi:hypothetical protein
MTCISSATDKTILPALPSLTTCLGEVVDRQMVHLGATTRDAKVDSVAKLRMTVE